VPLLKL
jgi:hypothetical protein